MAVTLSVGATTVDLGQGPDWGGQSSIEQALIWEQMSDGRWRRFDKGELRDIWSCQYSWTIPIERAADLRELLHVQARGQVVTLTADPGIDPFGPLVDCSSGIEVRVATASDIAMAPVSRDWTVQLSIVATPHPSTQGLMVVPARSDGLQRFLTVATASPSQDATWGIARSETSFIRSSRNGDSFAASLRALLPSDYFASALHSLVQLRGGTVNAHASRYPWGPGIAPNNNGYHLARVKAFSWSRSAPGLYSLSATIVQEPA